MVFLQSGTLRRVATNTQAPAGPALRALLAGSALLASVGPVLYPLGLWLVARRRPDPIPPAHLSWPTLTCVVAAYRESGVIAAKVADLLAQDYPSMVELVVVAEDAPTADAARRAGAHVVQPPDRVGKSAALGLGVAAGTGEVIVVSDANATLAPGSLRALGRWFDDPTVGAVAGEKRVRSLASGAGEGAYWAFESRLKRWENRMGSSVCLVGELGAVRRSLWRDVPADVAVDDLWIALDVVEQGARVVYEPAAVAHEDPSPTLADDVQRRTRIIAGAIDVLWRRRALLRGHGQVSLQLWGQTVVRSACAPSAHVLLAICSLAAARRGPRRAPLAALLALGHIVGATATVAHAADRPLPGPLAPVGQFGLLQAVALGGLWRFLRGEQLGRWPKLDRSGPPT